MPEGTTEGSSSDASSDENLRRRAERAVEDGRTIERLTRLMQEKNELEKRVERLQSATPADDEVTITESDAETLRELELLTDDGEVDPSGLREKLEQGQTAQEELESLRRQQRRRDVYEATSLNRKAAEDILPDAIEFKTEEGDEGMAVQVVDEDGQEHDLNDYLEGNFSQPVRDALTSDGANASTDAEETPSGAASTDANASEGSSGDQSSAGPSQSYPSQTPASTSQPDDSGDELSDEEIRQRKLTNQNYSA